MKTTIRLIFAAALLTTLAACDSSEYIIGTKTGSLLVSKGKPDLDEKTGMYAYKDAQGRSQMIKKDDVSQIMER